MTFSSLVKLKLITPFQASSLVSRITEFSERIVIVILALELELSKTNQLIIGTYKPPSLSDITFTSEIKNILAFYCLTHDSILPMRDFNMTIDNSNFNELIDEHELSALISEPTCFKSINPTYIDNFLTSTKNSFYEYSNI